EEMERTADIDMMAANAVVRGWCDDWDTLTRNRGKNGYFLRRVTDGKWMLIQWDSDLTFGSSNADFIGNLSGVRNFFEKPYIKQRVNHYLNEMVQKYTANSTRLAAWFRCEEDASTSYSSNESTYNSWNQNRLSKANSTIGSALNTDFNVTSGNGSSLSTSNDTVSLQGRSGADVFAIRVTGQPWVNYQFTNTTAWTLSGIQLRQGANVLEVQSVDQEGNVSGTENFTVNKGGNAAPVLVLDADPGSFRIPINTTFEVDGDESYDPEGTSLDFSFQLPAGLSISNPTPSSASMIFQDPGHYPLTIKATDQNGKTTQVVREIVAYANSGWDPFNQETLQKIWTTEDLTIKDGTAPSSSYSFDETPNRLAVKLETNPAKPLKLNSPNHPRMWRETPAGVWSFASEITLTSVQQGDFYTGIIVDGEENGSPVRFTVGMEDGDLLRAKKITTSSTTVLGSIGWTGKDAVVRIFKKSTGIDLQYRNEPGVWETLGSSSGNITTSQAGIFASTDTPQALRVEFDDSLLVDPSISSPTLENLRITEIMYHPIGGSPDEFIEIQNTGSTPLALDGASFDDTQPFAAFSFADVTLAPGQYAVIVSDESVFRARYGNHIPIVGSWASGALSNGGETIELRDPFGNTIHNFSYDDNAPWPLAADGTGPSLEVIDTEGNYNDPLNWRASAYTGGSPGFSKATDQDGDGLSNIRENALGTNPNLFDTDADGSSDGAETIAGTNPLDTSDYFRILSVGPSDTPDVIEITWASVTGKTYLVESSSDLAGNWSLHDSVTAGASTSRTTDQTSGERKFYRIRVSGP
ncbi:lamin tail domain-containing protein, partial [Akkermansiaceae bacterium]|nr:lamin tail domain-containing protein [Akkermansiaceae bacterium]